MSIGGSLDEGRSKSNKVSVPLLSEAWDAGSILAFTSGGFFPKLGGLSEAQPQDGISGLIERVTFHNEESGFAVLRVKVAGRRELVTVVGSLPAVSAGEWVTATGHWVEDREHGRQLKADFLKCSAPTSREGIEKYLGSGLIKGIGPTYAKKLVAHFGEEVFSIIDNYSARLEQIEGIGPGRRKKIKEAWTEQKIIRDIMVFLHSHGVGTSRATRIYKTYGEKAIDTIRANPYLLARDIAGIGFKTADAVARRMGIPEDSVIRARAGLLHQLVEASGNGHCALPRTALLEQAVRELAVKDELLEEALERLKLDAEVVEEAIEGDLLVFLPALRTAEIGIARILRRLVDAPGQYPPIDFDKAVAWCEKKTGKQLAESQKNALQRALQERVLILTGGPGVGKTTLLQALLLILTAKKVRCLLCAPTGRAAKRMSETTGLEARTIHRLLEFQPGSEGFSRHEKNPLETDLLVVDETSMVDVPLMHKLLRALPPNAHLLLVGDVDQLPSVGPGMVLRDLIESDIIPVVRLTEIFRQAADSWIITNAHRINAGEMPENGGRDADFHFLERADPDSTQALLVELVSRRIPERLHCDRIRDIQVLCAMNRGTLGTRNLNQILQEKLNPLASGEPEVERFGQVFRPRDKVMQTSNNYDKEVFNGDIGQVTFIDPMEQELRVRFDQREVCYDFNELDELVPAYAITIHKSQGSEFPVVVMPLATQQYLLLQRNLLYTGATRGKRLVVLAGEKKALSMAVHNFRPQERTSGLKARMIAG